MKLTKYSDYALRIMIYVGINRDRRCTIREIAVCYGISENHIMKLVHQLGLMGYLSTRRGKSGGIVLGKPPGSINLGTLIRKTEKNLELVECFNLSKNKCPIVGVCVLSSILDSALDSFFESLEQHTLEDLIKPGKALKRKMNIPVTLSLH